MCTVISGGRKMRGWGHGKEMRGKISLLVKRRYVHWNASVMLKIYHT